MKTILEQTKLDLQRWMDLPLSLIGRINTIRMNILPKIIFLFQSVSIKIPKIFFKEQSYNPFSLAKEIP